MRRLLPVLALLASPAAAQSEDLARWRAEAARVTITRDSWGIAHVHGVSDADAVFGAIYAQAEDDFPRIEANYLTALGRTAEADGEGAIWADLRQRLFTDPEQLKADYAASPAWLRELMDAWADGLNFYLATHPAEHPRVLTRFEPWMALSFTEGSIGGDVERVDLQALKAFYAPNWGKHPLAKPLSMSSLDSEPRGSNGIAVAPKLTRDGHALLLINPHTSFFFRSELGMESDQGLHAYGASTWGQFFLYQGWNEHLGWMHTSSGVDTVDEFAETPLPSTAGFDPKINLPRYRHGRDALQVNVVPVTIRYRRADGSMDDTLFVTWHTIHGPIVRSTEPMTATPAIDLRAPGGPLVSPVGGKWISVQLMNRPIAALEQSWLRTEATSFAAYMKVAALQANSSNNTILASAEGTIAYLHPQFVPVRDDRLDWRAPVDGATADWGGLTPLDKLPQVVNPRGGWLYNSNDAPWRAAGADSPRAADFPRYMDQVGANPRGDHATALLGKAHDLTPEGLRAIAYDPAQPAFDRLLPLLFADYDALPPGDAQRARLRGQVEALRRWDRRWSAGSTETTLAMFWGEQMWPDAVRHAHPPELTPWDWLAGPLPAHARLDALDRAVATLTRDHGSATVPWGKVNCFQRVSAAITPKFSDAGPCTPVPFTSAKWGSLASFGARPYPGTKRWYGTSGNSFVAVVEFGPRVKAMAVTAGGESGHAGSAHFADEAARYAAGALRPVPFYDDELKGHTERVYRPGE